MKVEIPDEYIASSGQTIAIEKREDGSFHVYCWNEDGSNHWHMDGVVLTDDGRGRQTRRPYTEEEAFAEFNRWRT